MTFRFPSKTNIGKLPGQVMLKLRDALDVSPESQNWRALVQLLKHPFLFRQHEIEKFGMQIYTPNGSPSGQLIQALSARGMRVCDLVPYLDALKLETVLMDFKTFEPIKIIEQPAANVKLYEGETLTLCVEATGFPYPRYQWFRGGDEPIDGATEPTLTIKNVGLENSSKYCCRLHNSADVNQLRLTNESEVQVYGRLKPTEYSDDQDTDFDNENVIVDEKYNLPVIVFHPRDCYVLSGSTVYLKCEVKGRQPMRYLWFQDNKFFAETHVSDLQINEVMPYHSGRYFCRVKNSYGEAVSVPAMVTVGCNPVYQKPHIIVQPVGCAVYYGGVAKFVCQAAGPEPIHYQWYQDDIEIPGATMSILVLKDVQGQALIQCEVSNEDTCVFSNKVLLSVSRWPTQNTMHPVIGSYTATDKVALLIGNYNYRCEHSLKAPKTDIQILSEIFRSLQFKVVSLLNLTLNEMQAAVKEFCRLLGDGVYAVFYFVGHGFEENGKCYFVPEDALTDFSETDCLCANAVLSAMQQRKPKICTMILDICRKRNKNGSLGSSLDSSQVIPIPKAGNCCICYATCVDMGAYEIGDTGILMKHLQKYLRQPLKIEDVFSNMRHDIGQDKLVEGKQVPEFRTNLLEPRRSFCDRIQYNNGWTEEFNCRCLAWQNAHVIPESQEVLVSKELGIVLALDFQSSFSNVLQIFVTVKEMGKTEECLAWISRLPNTVSVNELPNKVSEGKTKNSIQDIQKLKDDLEITLTIRYRLCGSAEEKLLQFEGINLGLPLVAKLKLWQPQPCREPTEQMEDVETWISPELECMERHK